MLQILANCKHIRELFNYYDYFSQKQPSRDVLKKSCSKNMQQIYSKTPMSKCDFKATLWKSHFGMGVLL